jgi:Protein of unknown function (DUF3486)
MRRPDIELLPTHVIEEIDRRLIGSGFSNYVGLSEWLKGEGFAIGKSQISRHAQKLKTDILEARKAALFHSEALKQLGNDDRGHLIAAAGDIGMLKAIEAFSQLDPIEDSKTLADLMRGTSALGRMALDQKKWNLISADEIERKLKQIETDELTKDKPSTFEEVVSQVRQTILGFSALETKIIDIEPNECEPSKYPDSPNPSP